MPKNRASRSHPAKQATYQLVMLGVLTAMCTAVSLLTLRPVQTIKLTLSFLPVSIAALLYGIPGAATVAGLADIIGCLVQGMGFPFPPITLTEMLSGCVFGFFLHGKVRLWRIAAAAAVTQFCISAFVTPCWLHLLYGMNYPTLLVSRIPQILIMFSGEMILLPLLLGRIQRLDLRKLAPGATVPRSKKMLSPPLSEKKKNETEAFSAKATVPECATAPEMDDTAPSPKEKRPVSDSTCT